MKFARKIEREREKEKVKDIHRTYEKKPKQKCPNCHKRSLFFTNADGEIFCLRCEEKIGTSNSNKSMI